MIAPDDRALGCAVAGQLRGVANGLPIILCSAGPSLHNELGLLRELQHRAILIAADGALAALVRAGIRPHLVTAVDSTNTVAVTARNLGIVSTVAAGTGLTVDHATTVGQLSVAAQWQLAGLAAGVTPAVGVVFKSNTAGAIAAASATAAGTGPSTSIRAMASCPGALRPKVKLAMLTLASPRMVPSLPMKPGLSSLTI